MHSTPIYAAHCYPFAIALDITTSHDLASRTLCLQLGPNPTKLASNEDLPSSGVIRKQDGVPSSCFASFASILYPRDEPRKSSTLCLCSVSIQPHGTPPTYPTRIHSLQSPNSRPTSSSSQITPQPHSDPSIALGLQMIKHTSMGSLICDRDFLRFTDDCIQFIYP